MCRGGGEGKEKYKRMGISYAIGYEFKPYHEIKRALTEPAGQP